MRHHDVIIRSPVGEQYTTTRAAMHGVSWDDIERGDRKGYGDRFAITPGMVKQYIKEQCKETAVA